MELVRIFADPKPRLYAIKFSDEETNEFDRNFDLWNDPEYLQDFFEKYSSDLRGYNQFHRKEYRSKEAVRKTVKDAENLENRLLDIALSGNKDEYKVLQALFRPLNDMETDLYPLQRSKGKLKYQSWLRIYAVRIDVNLYVMTGGAIKLTHRMEESEHSQKEVYKLNRVVEFLRAHHLINEKAFKRLELGL